jgi:hypothetical protein
MPYETPSVPVTAILILGFFLGPHLGGYSQIAHSGARTAALGGAATALGGEPWMDNNPSLTASLERHHLELFSSRSFGMSELQLAAAAYAIPSDLEAFSVTARSFGFSGYRNTQVGLGYARELSETPAPPASAGLLLIYDHESIKNYRSSGSVGIVLGGSLHLSSSLLLGLQAANIHRPVKASTTSLPQQLSVGIGYSPSASTQLVLDLQKETRYPLAVRAGIEFRPGSALAVRMGIATIPRLFTVGIGIAPGVIRGGLAFLYHYALGWSPGVSVGTSW